MGRIDWIEIEHLTDDLKDGRELLAWNGTGPEISAWPYIASATYFAEINPPGQRFIVPDVLGTAS